MVLPRCSPHNFCLPQKVLGTVSTVSEAGPTPSASLQEIRKLFGWNFVTIRQTIFHEKGGESKWNRWTRLKTWNRENSSESLLLLKMLEKGFFLAKWRWWGGGLRASNWRLPGFGRTEGGGWLGGEMKIEHWRRLLMMMRKPLRMTMRKTTNMKKRKTLWVGRTGS